MNQCRTIESLEGDGYDSWSYEVHRSRQDTTMVRFLPDGQVDKERRLSPSYNDQHSDEIQTSLLT